MKTKHLSLLLAFLMFITMLAGCAQTQTETPEEPGPSEVVDPVEPETSEVVEPVDPNIITLRENAVISTTPAEYNTPEIFFEDGVYYQKFDPYNVTGCLSSMQVNVAYTDDINVNSDSVMVYTQNESSVQSWNAVDDRYNIDMMIA